MSAANHTRIVGLTGSIGMGKSTTSSMFKALGVPVHDADAVVHSLYQDRSVAQRIETSFPATRDQNGAVDRRALSTHVIGHPEKMKKLEAIIHPMVQEAEQKAVEKARRNNEPYIILDIPLLFETGGDMRCDAIVVVTADPDIQRKRVLARPGMTQSHFEAILAKQLPDAKKRERADFLVDTSHGLQVAQMKVAQIHAKLIGKDMDNTRYA